MSGTRGGRMSLSLNPLSLSSNSTKPSPAPNNSYFNESNIHQDIKITFTLPNGEMIEETVKNGETVQEIKRRMYSASKIPSNSMFYFNGKHMLDPYSLNDIPGVEGLSALQIEVKVKDATPQIPTTHSASESGKTGSESGGSTQEDIPASSTHNPPTTQGTSSPQSLPPTTSTAEDKQHSGNGRDEKGNTSPHTSTINTTTSTTPISTPTEPPRNKVILPKIPTLNLHDNSNSPPPPQPAPLPVTHTNPLPSLPPKIPTLNLVENAPTSSQSDALPATPDPIPSLPHAAYDDNEPIMPPPPEKNSSNGKRESGNGESGVTSEPPTTTTIEVNDGENEKPIETLGNGGRKWKFCFLV